MTSDDGNILSMQNASPFSTEFDSTSTLMDTEQNLNQHTAIKPQQNSNIEDSSSSSASNMNTNLNPTEMSNQLSSNKILNDSINTDMLSKSVNKISYPLEEESIFMKDTSNEENNSQNEQNISRDIGQLYHQSKLNTDEQTLMQHQQQNLAKDLERPNPKVNAQPLFIAENTSSAIEMPTIVVHAGPAPPKKIPTTKATTALVSHSLLNNAKPSLKKKLNHTRRKKKVENRDTESSGTQTDSESNNEDDDLNDDDDDEEEYKPKKMLKTHHLNTNSDSEIIVMTSDDENSLAKRKPARVTKKPKVFEDFETSSPNCQAPQQTVDVPKIDVTSTPLIQQQQPPQVQTTKAKQFARKSTAPLTASNSSQNILAASTIQPQVKPQQQIPPPVNAKPPTSHVKSPITSVISANNHQHHNNQNQNANNKFSSNNSLNNHIHHPLNSNTILKPLVTNAQQTQSTSTTTPVKQYRHKIVSCKPFCQSKATECYPNMRDASTQVDLDEIKLQHTIVPVPVPINVPIPMFMFQAPLPMPILLPVPIPVPVYIPTTKKTFDRVERRIKVDFI
jgi:hypothetical protein